MSILERIRANGGDVIRDGYSFRLRPGQLDAAALDWVKKNIEAVKREVWPAYDDWQERAAIIEFDGGMSREKAEKLAYQEVSYADAA
ncbi:hypothetical protein [Henriciella sp.]|uniref:hypothetical protein n=1 Tax=Henriciella sp. TaxID=1968823 RepID=UPI00262A1B2A|nr:hypothetical protein [Henriciella sp.]